MPHPQSHARAHKPQPRSGLGHTRLQTDDITTFMEVTDVEKIDMILESPQAAFKGNFDERAVLRTTNYRVLGTLGIVAITYLYASGGPIGSEPIVNSGGSLIGFISLLVYPLIMTIPYAYIVAELCSAFPEDGGFTIWVLNAFGPFWAFQVGYWSWVSGVIRSAIVPAAILQLFLDYYGRPDMTNAMAEYFVKAGIGLVLGFPALFGSLPVSRLSLLLTFITVVTFLVYTVWAYTTARDFDDLFEIRHSNDTYNNETRDVVKSGDVDIDWDTLVNTLFFKFDGIYMASVFGGEVMNPARTYPRAIFFTVLLTVATYLVPLPASILADDLSWFDFERNAYPTMALAVGGQFLKTVILVGSVCASIGGFTSGIFIKSFMLSGMASNRLLPMALAHRSVRFEAPTYGIVITTIFSALLAGLEFGDLLPLSNAFAAIVQVIIIVAAMRLRMTLPYIPRPTKVPGGVPGMMILATVPAVVLGYILLDCFLDSLIASLMLGGLLVAGMAYGFWAVRWN